MERRLPGIIRFASRVLRDFFLHNHGLLLTAAVAFNMMLSLIPLSAVLIVIVSHFFDQTLLLDTLTSEISLIAPGFTPILTDVLTGFLRTRGVVGWVGLGSLLVFSSFAFRVLEDAISIIFHQPLPTHKRKFWVSALMPYLFIFIVAGGLIAVTTVNAVIDVQSQREHFLFGFQLSLHQHFNHLVYLTGLLGLVLLFTLFYQIMPVAKIPFRLALAGGLTATILWELVRHLRRLLLRQLLHGEHPLRLHGHHHHRPAYHGSRRIDPAARSPGHRGSPPLDPRRNPMVRGSGPATRVRHHHLAPAIF